MSDIKVCRWLDSNPGPLELEGTALPSEPQPLHFLVLPQFLNFNLLLWSIPLYFSNRETFSLLGIEPRIALLIWTFCASRFDRSAIRPPLCNFYIAIIVVAINNSSIGFNTRRNNFCKNTSLIYIAWAIRLATHDGSTLKCTMILSRIRTRDLKERGQQGYTIKYAPTLSN